MPEQDDSYQVQRVKNLSLAAIAGLSGFATIVIITIALFIGFWLDAQLFGTRGLCTFGMLVLSVPFSLYTMLRITLGAIKRIIPQTPYQQEQVSSHTEEV